MATALQDRLGQMLVVGLSGPELDAPARDLLTTIRPGGVVLFRRNLAGPRQTAEFCRAIRRLLEPPPFLVIDQEGGRVSRLTPPFPDLPPAARLGRLEMVSIARWFGALTGRGLRCLGFQADYAPVVDLSREGDEDGIGDRSFSADPDAAAARAGAFLAGLEEAGVLGCLKHFPGLGGAPGDTHQLLPRMTPDEEARRRALRPYNLLKDLAPMVMIAHAHYPDLSGEAPLPASLDRRIVHGLLRETMAYAGVIVSDDLEMGAVAGRGGMDELALAAAAAGCDQVLVCQRPEKIHAAWEGLRRGAAGGDLDSRELEAALGRITTLKAHSAMTRGEESFEPEELEIVVKEMRTLTREVENAISRQSSGQI
ncbi:MAG: hypothetical protein O7A07_04085 [Acidobacteria bacterium]|nr:hypothetical protein [Acidobacteriota bacterium]